MKKIVAVLWHNSANRLNMLQSQTDEFVCLKVYSAAALSDGRQDLDKLYRDMDDADAFLFQVTSSDSAWIEIEEYAEKYDLCWGRICRKNKNEGPDETQRNMQSVLCI